MQKALIAVGVLLTIIVIMAMVGSTMPNPANPTRADLNNVAKNIMDVCDRQVLGHQRAPGEAVSPLQKEEIGRCINKTGGAYVEAVKTLQKQ